MKTLKIFIAILSISVITACGNKVQDADKPEIEKGKVVENYDNYKNSTNVNFTNVVLEGNYLLLEFTYSGGCENHEFALIGLKAFAKSIPPIRNIKLFHNGNGDNCRELITEKRTYDIRPFGHQTEKEVKLILEGWSEPILYTLPSE